MKFGRRDKYLHSSSFSPHPLQILGHRGARGSWPENTLPSIMAAVEAGVDGVEIDLLGTKDGEIILHHNFFINPDLCRYFDGTPMERAVLISGITYSEIKKIDCGAKHPDFPKQKSIPGTAIPTLKELFTALQQSNHPNAHKVELNLEIKADPTTPSYILKIPQLVKIIVDLVRQYKFTDHVYYSSFDPNILKEVRRVDPHAKLGFLFDTDILDYANIDLFNWVEYAAKKGEEVQAQIISPDYLLLNKINIHELQKKGFQVVTWTVNDYLVCKELINKGIDGIITDYPYELIQLLRKEYII